MPMHEKSIHELEVGLAVTQVFHQLGIAYCVGGSFASTVYGEARSTRDIDILAAMQARHSAPFVTALQPAFYVQREDIDAAIRLAPALRASAQQRASFSMIHQASFFKVDVFVSSGRPFDLSQLARAVALEVTPEQSMTIASAEDTILTKLEWYRMGNDVSDRQWRDVLSVLAAQQDKLDYQYLNHWAAMLQIHDILRRALGDDAPPASATQLPLF